MHVNTAVTFPGEWCFPHCYRSRACDGLSVCSPAEQPRYQYNYPIALEGALKLKEISYRFAEGHPSAELKHGVIALVRPEVQSIIIAPDDAVLEKNINAIEQIKARKGKVIAVATEGRKDLARLADDVMYIPKCPDFASPILTVVPLQLFAYYLAVQLGCDVDKPRNLAKSVTVE
jgi:glutamine---fructose-6-phosphate transaminase (isomerizing)